MCEPPDKKWNSNNVPSWCWMLLTSVGLASSTKCSVVQHPLDLFGGIWMNSLRVKRPLKWQIKYFKINLSTLCSTPHAGVGFFLIQTCALSWFSSQCPWQRHRLRSEGVYSHQHVFAYFAVLIKKNQSQLGVLRGLSIKLCHCRCAKYIFCVWIWMSRLISIKQLLMTIFQNVEVALHDSRWQAGR